MASRYRSSASLSRPSAMRSSAALPYVGASAPPSAISRSYAASAGCELARASARPPGETTPPTARRRVTGQRPFPQLVRRHRNGGSPPPPRRVRAARRCRPDCRGRRRARSGVGDLAPERTVAERRRGRRQTRRDKVARDAAPRCPWHRPPASSPSCPGVDELLFPVSRISVVGRHVEQRGPVSLRRDCSASRRERRDLRRRCWRLRRWPRSARPRNATRKKSR